MVKFIYLVPRLIKGQGCSPLPPHNHNYYYCHCLSHPSDLSKYETAHYDLKHQLR